MTNLYLSMDELLKGLNPFAVDLDRSVFGKVLYYMGKPCIFIEPNKIIVFFECDYCHSKDSLYEFNLFGVVCCRHCGAEIR